MLGTCCLHERVGNGLTVHALGEITKFHGHAAHSRGLLGGGDFGQTKGNNVLGAHTVTLGTNRVAHLSRKVLIRLTSLRNRLSTGLGELVVHLGEDGQDLSGLGIVLIRREPVTRGNAQNHVIGERDSIGAGNAILLGSHRATPICPTLGLSFLASVWRGKWHRLDPFRVLRYSVGKVPAWVPVLPLADYYYTLMPYPSQPRIATFSVHPWAVGFAGWTVDRNYSWQFWQLAYFCRRGVVKFSANLEAQIPGVWG